VSWRFITNEWRLKLLAFALAVLMLGAVAFSQTRPTTKTVTVGLNYTVPPNIILLNPPSKTTVTVSGLADVVDRADANNVFATADATGARPGAAVKLNVAASSTVHNLATQNPPPIVVNIDTLQAVALPVQVNLRAAPGWVINSSKTLATCPGATSPNPCKVVFTGPVTWESGLKAVVTVGNPVTGTGDLLNQAVSLQTPKGSLDQSVPTAPPIGIEVTSANIHYEAVAGTTSESVPLVDSPPSHPPPSGYRVTAVTISPLLVTVTGDPAVLLRLTNVALPPVDLSTSTSDATFQVAIPYPNGVSGSVANATVKYAISKNPNVSPTPSP
jgi:YbbR domain-containing protein